MIVNNGIGYLSNLTVTDLSMNTIAQTETILKSVDTILSKHYSTKVNILTFTLYYKSKSDFDSIYKVCELWKPKNLEIQYIGNVFLQNDSIIMISLITTIPKLHSSSFIDRNVNFIV
jgi:hypothetical protein